MSIMITTQQNMMNTTALHDVIEQMVIRAGDTSNPRTFGELVLIEAIMLSKMVVVDRLLAYVNPNYKERRGCNNKKGRGDDNVSTVEMIGAQIKDTLCVNFSDIKPAMNQFYTLVILPILDVMSEKGIHEFVSDIDMDVLDDTADDIFGSLMRSVKNSTNVPSLASATAAHNNLFICAKHSRNRRKKLTK